MSLGGLCVIDSAGMQVSNVVGSSGVEPGRTGRNYSNRSYLLPEAVTSISRVIRDLSGFFTGLGACLFTGMRSSTRRRPR